MFSSSGMLMWGTGFSLRLVATKDWEEHARL